MRPTIYTPELVEQAWSYCEVYKTEHGHSFPSAVGLARVLKVAKSTLYKWATEENKELSDILEIINDYQHFDLTEGGIKGEFNPTITKLMLTKHDYSDKQETEHKGHISTDLSDDELDRAIAERRQGLDEQG